MAMNPLHQIFSTTELLKIINRAGLRLEHERLKEWHKRGFVPYATGVGKGREREYNVTQTVYLAFLVFFCDRAYSVRQEREGRLFQAAQLAHQATAHVMEQYRTEVTAPVMVAANDRGIMRLELIDPKLSVGIAASGYAFRGALLVDLGTMAGILGGSMSEAIRAREKRPKQ